MTRRYISLEELNKWLSKQVSSHPDCEGTEVTIKYELQQPDSGGCNWSAENIQFRPGPKANSEMLDPIVREAVIAARQKFNLQSS